MLALMEFFKIIGRICLLPLEFGVLLLFLFIGYIVLFAWLNLVPIFSGHFRFMSEVWFLGLRIVANKNVLKMAGIGILILIIASILS